LKGKGTISRIDIPSLRFYVTLILLGRSIKRTALYVNNKLAAKTFANVLTLNGILKILDSRKPLIKYLYKYAKKGGMKTPPLSISLYIPQPDRRVLR